MRDWESKQSSWGECCFRGAGKQERVQDMKTIHWKDVSEIQGLHYKKLLDMLCQKCDRFFVTDGSCGEDAEKFMEAFQDQVVRTFHSKTWKGTVSHRKARIYEVAVNTKTKKILKSMQQFFRVDQGCYVSFDADLQLDISFYCGPWEGGACMFYTITHEGLAYIDEQMYAEWNVDHPSAGHL